MLHQLPGIQGRVPGIFPVATLLLCLIQLQPRITLVNGSDGFFSGPLETDATDVFTAFRIVQQGIDQGGIRSFHSSEHHFDTFLFHGRAQIVTHKLGQSGCRPATTREYLCRIEFILRHHHRDVNTFFPIGINEFGKIKRISRKIFRLTDEHVRSFRAFAVFWKSVIHHLRHIRTFACLQCLGQLACHLLR